MSTLGEQTRDTLIALYTKTESYLGVKPAETAAAVSVPDAPADFLEQLSSFQRFKRLGDALEVHLNKRVTLIFGANGSGKSSLCEALKVLATREPPNRPLQNVRAAGAANPEFRYKFRSDAVPQAWSPAVGYGPRRTTVKYFDTSIAIGNVKNAVEPGRVIVLTPFRLHIFEWAQAMTTKLREALQREQRENSAKLTQAWEEVRADFAMFKGRPLSVINDRTVAVLPAQIKLGDEFADQNLLNEKQVAANELERAMSEGGLRLLRAEHSELERFLTSLNTLLTSAVAVWALEPASKTKAIAARRVAQEVLAKSLVPRDGTLDALLALLRAASPLCKMNDAAGQACPLCRQELGVPEVDLFKRYHGLLMGKLEESISALKGDIDKATVLATAVVNVDRKAWDKYTTIQMDVLTATKTGSDLIVANCEVFKEPAPEAKAVLESLKTSAAAWGAQLESKKKAIDAAAKGREELVKQLAKLHGEIEPLEYAQAIARRMEKLKEAERIVATAAFWNSTLSAFTPLLKKITNKAKEAHEELVVVDFEAHLNADISSHRKRHGGVWGDTRPERDRCCREGVASSR